MDGRGRVGYLGSDLFGIFLHLLHPSPPPRHLLPTREGVESRIRAVITIYGHTSTPTSPTNPKAKREIMYCKPKRDAGLRDGLREELKVQRVSA